MKGTFGHEVYRMSSGVQYKLRNRIVKDRQMSSFLCGRMQSAPTKNLLFVAFMAVILWAVPGTAALAVNEIAQPIAVGIHSDDEKILRGQADDYVKAFAVGDYKTIAAMWTEDGTFIDIDGQVLHGRIAIESYFKTNFEKFGGQPLEIAIDSIRFPGDNIAIEEGHSRLLQGPAIDVVSHYSVVHVKQNDKWQMYAVTETTYPEALKGSLGDWEWLIGNWSAKQSPTKSINVIATWAPGHKFMRCLFETENSTAGKQFTMVVLGQDPNSGRIISWHFDPSGSFGSGKWIKDGQTWIERSTSVEANGATGSALYTLHKLDDNNFTWRSTQRYLDSSPLPDSEEVTISRIGTAGK